MLYIRKHIENYNIIDINFNELKYENLKEYHALNDYVESKYIAEKYDIYITGSNAFLLSSDLATLFTGRTFEIEIFPFSFKEFIKYYNYTDLDDAFKKYILNGGMSGSYLYENETDKYKYILQGKRYLESQDKYYLVDPTFKYAKLGMKRDEKLYIQVYQYEGIQIYDIAKWLAE